MISILGARTKELVILEDEIRAISDELFITTDDGSYGAKGLVTDQLKALIAAGRKIDLVLAIGPVRMMQAVAEVDPAARHQDGRQPQLADGRRHRHVRRLPRAHDRRAPSSPASTAPSSTPTRSTSTSSSSATGCTSKDEAESLQRVPRASRARPRAGPRVVPAGAEASRGPSARPTAHERTSPTPHAVEQGAGQDPPAAHARAGPVRAQPATSRKSTRA